MILLFVLIYSGIKIFKWYKDKTNNNKIAEQIKSTVIVEEKTKMKQKPLAKSWLLA